jgi:hypothetical protein
MLQHKSACDGSDSEKKIQGEGKKRKTKYKFDISHKKVSSFVPKLLEVPRSRRNASFLPFFFSPSGVDKARTDAES